MQLIVRLHIKHGELDLQVRVAFLLVLILNELPDVSLTCRETSSEAQCPATDATRSVSIVRWYMGEI